MKILVFINDPTIAHDVARTVARMTKGFDQMPEVHLSRVQRFEDLPAMGPQEPGDGSIGFTGPGNAGAAVMMHRSRKLRVPWSDRRYRGCRIPNRQLR